jgi:hypothetical protein
MQKIGRPLITGGRQPGGIFPILGVHKGLSEPHVVRCQVLI